MNGEMFKEYIHRIQQLNRRITRKQLKQAGIGLSILLVPLGVYIYAGYIDGLYELSEQSRQLVGEPAPKVVDKLDHDESEGTFAFNAKEKEEDAEDNKPETFKASVQADSGGSDNKLYSADIHEDVAKGMEIHDNNLDLSFSITPQFETRNGQLRDGRLIYPLRGQKGKLVYTPKTNGMKEDIVLDKPAGDELSYEYKLDLPDTLEARLLDNGGIGVFSADPLLYGDINYGTDEDQARIERTRANSDKDHLVFAIPAPVIEQAPEGDEASKAEAEFTLEKDIITLEAKGLEAASYPLSIDPSVVVTSSSDFGKGNNEGGINFGADEISQDGISGGDLEPWINPEEGSEVGMDQLSEPRDSHVSLIKGDYIYVIGGRDLNQSSTPVNDVYYAEIDTDGVISNWQTTSSLDTSREHHTAVVHGDYMYVIGGHDDNDDRVSSVEYTFINTDGTLDAWQTTTSLPEVRRNHTSVVYGDYIYVMGGFTSSRTDSVIFSEVNGDATLGNWQTTTSLSESRDFFGGAVNGDRIYIAGGRGSGPGDDYLSLVEYAQINTDGTIGSWQTTAALPETVYQHDVVTSDGYIYSLGGLSGDTSSRTNTVHYASIDGDGSVGQWQETSALIDDTDMLSAVEGDGRLYVAGGRHSNGSSSDMVIQALVNTDGTLGAWSGNVLATEEGVNMGTARYGQGVAVYDGYIYAVGGYDSSYLNTVEYAPINSGGDLGTWRTTTNLSTGRYGEVVAYNGYLYTVGGYEDGTGSLDSVEYAQINSDGSLDEWKTTTSMNYPSDDFNPATVYDGYIYVTGSYDADADEYTDTVEYAPINGDGSLGEWQTTTSMNAGRYMHTAEAYNGHLYIIGGLEGGSNNTDEVEYAPINDDGTLGSWETTSSLVNSRWEHSSVVLGGYMYVIAAEGNTEDTVEYAAIKADGSLGEWQETESLTQPRYGHDSVAYKGYIYTLGGWDDTEEVYLDSVEYTQAESLGVFIDDWASTTQLWEYDWDCGLLCTDQDRIRRGHKMLYYNDYVYVLGGQTAGGSGDDSRAEVGYAEVQGDGALGSWSTTSSMPAPRHSYAAAVYDGYIYVFGGQDDGWNSNSWSVEINSDGSLGSWNSNANAGDGFDGTFSEAEAAVYNGHIYLIGTDNAGDSASLFAEINGDGTLGDWQDANDASLGGSGSNWDFNSGSDRFGLGMTIVGGYIYVFGGSSESDSNNYDDSNVTDTVEYAPINDNGSLGEWQYTTSLPEVRVRTEPVEMQGRIYLIGGTTFDGSTPSALDSVMYTEVSDDGSLGSWQDAPSLTMANNKPAASITPEGYLHLTGGDNAGNGEAFYSSVSNTGSGSLSDWTAEGEAMNTARYSHGVVATDNYMYAIGGENGSGGLSSVEYAPINEDGSIGMWQTTEALSKEIVSMGTAIKGDYIYVVGGYDKQAEDQIDDVYYAEINNDGSLEPWQATSSLADGSRAYNFSAAVVNDYVYAMGGYGEREKGTLLYEVDNNNAAIYQYEVEAPYDVTATSPKQSIDTQDSAPTGIAWNDDGSKLYEVGAASDLIYEYDLSEPYDIDTATFSQSISTQDGTPDGIAWNDDGSKLYEVGSDSDSIYEYDVSTPYDISTASFSTSISTQDTNSDGIAWNDDGSKLYEVGSDNQLIYEYDVSTPYDISTASSSQNISTQDSTPTGIAWNDDGSKLYEVGSGSDAIYEYDVSTPYDISTATFSQSISTQNTSPQSVAWNNSTAKGDKSSVEYAPISSDGSLGAWQTTADLPSGRYATAAATAADRIYLVGGFETGNTCYNDVLMAEPETDGSIDSWSQESSFNGSRCEHTVTAYGGHLYIIGTRVDGSHGTEIQRAQIYSNGRLSNWDNLYENTGLPTEIERHGAVASDGRLYVVGGTVEATDTFYDAVYTADIDIITRDGRYSHLVDLSNPSKLNSLEFNGGGYGDISLSLAGACSAPFTSIAEGEAESAEGLTIFPTAAYAQQVQVSFDIDDNYNATYPYNSGFGSITDFTLDYTPLRADTDERLRAGNYFSQGIEQPYDSLPETAEGTSGGCAEFINSDTSEDPEPELTTAEVTSITETSATSGGEITDEGDSAITERGIAYSTSPGPTTDDNTVTSGSGTGSFTADMTGLDADTEYYVRAYAINSEGTFYGQQRDFITDLSFSYSTGDTGPAGGVIVYVDTDDEHSFDYLEAAPGRLNNEHEWGCAGTSIPTDTAIGSGEGNTAAILSGCSDTGIAAEQADNYTNDGFDDWFLPSRDELQQVYIHRSYFGNLGTTDYWSSSEYSSTSAWRVNLDDGEEFNDVWKTGSYRVIPMRSFSE